MERGEGEVKHRSDAPPDMTAAHENRSGLSLCPFPAQTALWTDTQVQHYGMCSILPSM